MHRPTLALAPALATSQASSGWRRLQLRRRRLQLRLHRGAKFVRMDPADDALPYADLVWFDDAIPFNEGDDLGQLGGVEPAIVGVGLARLKLSQLFNGTLAPNKQYKVYVAANDTNIYFDIWRVYTAPDGQVGYQFIQGGDCLYMGVDPRVCGRNAFFDQPNASRTFVLNTKDSIWDVSSWYID